MKKRKKKEFVINLVVLLSEPVDVEDLGKLVSLLGGLLSKVEPVGKVVGHIVATEGDHGEGIKPQGSNSSLSGSSEFRGNRGPNKGSMLPVEGLENKGHPGCPATAKDDGIDRHTLGILKLGGDDGALLGRDGEAGVGMGGLVVGGLGGKFVAEPVGQIGGALVGEPLPPDIIVLSEGHVGEDGVLADGFKGAGVGLVRGSRGHPEEAVFRVDRVHTSVVAEFHPGNVVSDTFDLPAWDGGLKHGQVGLSAG